jgi:hypothetical protein
MIKISSVEGFENIKDFYYMYKRKDHVYFKNKKTGRKVKPFEKKGIANGYMYLKLPTIDGTFQNIRVHRLIAAAYIPNEDDLLEVHHIDDNRKNNKINNLQWIDRQENMYYRWNKEPESEIDIDELIAVMA